MIVFNKVKIQNFLSVGNKPQELTLDTNKITTVSGENGSAKSAICIDSIYYALYGKSFRKTSLPKLVNAMNKKGLLVELEFTINQNHYLVRRGIKPNIFEIYVNGVMKPQMANVKDYQSWLMNYVLKMDERTFRQLVVVGSSSYVPFMSLTAQERRVIIEQLLQIDIFSQMGKIAKQMYSDINLMLSDVKHKIDTVNIKLEMERKSEKEKLYQYDENIQQHKEHITNLEKEITVKEEEHNSVLKTLNKETFNKLQTTSKNLTNTINTIKQLRVKKVTAYEMNNKMISFFENNDCCPTCTQTLDNVFVKQKIEELTSKKKNHESDLNEFDSKLNELQTTYNNTKLEIEEILKTLDVSKHIKNDIEKIRTQIAFCESQIKELQEKKRKQSLTESVSIQNYQDELLEYKNQLNELTNKSEILEAIIQLLKDDGVKSVILKSYMPIFNKLIAKYLNLINFNIVFELDENFNEHIKSGCKNVYEYSNFSEGERWRINVAIMHSLREISKLHSNVTTNILMLDEAEGGVADESAISNYTDILKSLNENVFIISHQPDFYYSISDRNLFVKKVNGYSRIVEE